MKISNLLSRLVTTQRNILFKEIIGYDHIKRLLRMVLDSDSVAHILLVGPPASAKTMFLTSLMNRLANSYFVDGGNSTKAGTIDYLFANKPRCLLIDEIDKMARKEQTFLLNLVETGVVSETKYGNTRSARLKASVFATSNNTKNLTAPLLSRFFIIELEPYTYEQFCSITNGLLLRHRVELDIANLIANAVWNNSRDIRDCVRIGTITKSLDDVRFVLETFL